AATYGNAGAPYGLPLRPVPAPEPDVVTSYLHRCGDRNSAPQARNGVQTHTYADGPNSYNVTVDVVDEDGTFTNAANALSVTVDNDPQSVVVGDAGHVSDGAADRLSMAPVRPPRTDAVTRYIVHCG